MSSPVAYVPLDQQVAEEEILEERLSKGVLSTVEPTSDLPVCLPGQCLVRRDNGLQIMSVDSSAGRCAINC